MVETITKITEHRKIYLYSRLKVEILMCSGKLTPIYTNTKLLIRTDTTYKLIYK